MEERQLSTVETQIAAVLLGAGDPEVQGSFVERYKSSLDDFIAEMTKAIKCWKRVDSRVQGSEEIAHVSSLVFGVINNHIVSMKLFLMGLPIAAGNMDRQVIEGMALALLVSRRDIGVRKKYMEGKYSTHKALRDAKRYASKLGIDPVAVQQFELGSKFRDQLSHPSFMTVAHSMFLNPTGRPMIGGFFDKGKLEIYDKEVKIHVSLASTMCNFIEGVEQNLVEDVGR